MSSSLALSMRPVAARPTTFDASQDVPATPPDATLLQSIAVLQQFGARPGGVFCDREADALAALYHEHASTLLQIAGRLTRNVDDAQDVVQGVFVDLPKALQQYRTGNFKGWLRCVTARAALMWVRRRTRRHEESDIVLADSPLAVSEQEDFDALEDAAALRRAVDALREPYRQIIVLRVYADLSHQEIAAILGITPNASEVRLCRAIKQLRELLTSGRGALDRPRLRPDARPLAPRLARTGS